MDPRNLPPEVAAIRRRWQSAERLYLFAVALARLLLALGLS